MPTCAPALPIPSTATGAARRRIGTGGDFITAPEISQVFGELIGLWCAVVWQSMGSPAPLRLVELGPGRGTLMRDALRAARAVPPFLAAASVHLIETSAPLRETQQQTLGSNPVVSLSNHGGCVAAVLRQAQDEGGMRRPVPIEWHEAIDAGAGGAGDRHRQRVPGCPADPAAGVRRWGLARARGRRRCARRPAVCRRAKSNGRNRRARNIAAARSHRRAARRGGRAARSACRARIAARGALHRLRPGAAGDGRHAAGGAPPRLGRPAQPTRPRRSHGPRAVRVAWRARHARRVSSPTAR